MNIIVLLVEIICLFSVISACSDDPPKAPEGASSDWDNSTKVEGTLITYTCITGEEVMSVCDVISLTWMPSIIICADTKRRQNGKKVKRGRKVKKEKKSGKKGKKKVGRKHGRKSGEKRGDKETQSCTCGVKKTLRIVGGRPAKVFDWPWIARIGAPSEYHCAGSLIADQWILTAAHCTHRKIGENNYEERKPNELAVTLGDHNSDALSDEETLLLVAKIINHNQYKAFGDYYRNDISLIKLHQKVDLNKYTPICLPNAGTTNVGEMVDVYGWGKISFNGEISAILRETSVKVITNKACIQRYASLIFKDFVIIDRNLCAYTEGKDTCQGDSGGSLTYNDNGKHKQVGIVSWGLKCAENPGVYTRVTKYLGWIKKNTDANGGAVYCNN